MDPDLEELMLLSFPEENHYYKETYLWMKVLRNISLQEKHAKF